MSSSNVRKPKAVWRSAHIKEMLDFLIGKLSEMGEGDFKTQTWNQVGDHLRNKFPVAVGEGPKSADACKQKFSRVCPIVPSPYIIEY
jgi:hypothetical protein